MGLGSAGERAPTDWVKPPGWLDERYEWPHLLVTIVKNGALTREELFGLRGAVADTAYDDALDRAITDPSIAARPFGYCRSTGDVDVTIQFIDLVDGLEEAILHSDYDEDAQSLHIAPDHLVMAARVSEAAEDELLGWLHLIGTRYHRPADSGEAITNVLLGRIRA